MLSDRELRSELRAALEAVSPPAPWLSHRVEQRLRSSMSTGTKPRAHQVRLGLNLVAILVLIAVAIAAVGVFLVTHQPLAPANPGAGTVVLPGTTMVSPTTGWAAMDQVIWRTTDGGRTWKDVSPPVVPDFTFNPGATGRYFLDGTHAWVAESTLGPAGVLSITSLSTGDGGRSWQVGSPITGLHPFFELYPQLYFFDAAHGWLVVLKVGESNQAIPVLFSTSDGGRHWSLRTELPAIPSGCVSLPVFATVSTGWMMAPACGAAAPSLLVTHDGGASWRAQPLPVVPQPNEWLETPVFFDKLRGLAVLHRPPSFLLVTSDGGSSWSTRSLPGEIQIDVSFVDANHGWLIAGSNAELGKFAPVPSGPLPLYQTVDGGLTWTPIATDLLQKSGSDQLDTLYFVDQKRGFASYMNDSGFVTRLMATADGGHTWTVVAKR